MKDKKSVLKLNTKTHTKIGIASVVVGAISLLLLVVSVYISAFRDRGNVTYQNFIGIAELIAFFLSLGGITFGVMGEMSVDTYKQYAHIGVGVNFLLIVGHIAILASGY